MSLAVTEPLFMTKRFKTSIIFVDFNVSKMNQFKLMFVNNLYPWIQIMTGNII